MDHLTATCIAARLAGMSYGNYVAMMHDRDPTAKEVPLREGERIVTCGICGKKFITKSYCAKFCSNQCRRDSIRTRNKKYYTDKKRIGE